MATLVLILYSTRNDIFIDLYLHKLIATNYELKNHTIFYFVPALLFHRLVVMVPYSEKLSAVFFSPYFW